MNDESIYDLYLRDVITAAVVRLNGEMAEKAPFMAGPVGNWMKQLSGSAQAADYFLHPVAFPMFLLPWWLEKGCRSEPDLSFQADLAYSTANGYYYIRLIDNVMDGDIEIDVKLLPALNFFHSQFQAAYYPYFSAGHPFWQQFMAIWVRSGEAAMQEAGLPEIDQAQFSQIAAQKICAAKIPVMAVCYHYERPELINPWFLLIDRLGCWHQLMNDLFDWPKDMNHHNQTYFLAEAGRSKQPDETITAWVIRTGFAWGCALLQTWMAELKGLAEDLQSQELLAYLQKREAMFLEKQAQVIAGFQSLARVMAVVRPGAGQ